MALRLPIVLRIPGPLSKNADDDDADNAIVFEKDAFVVGHSCRKNIVVNKNKLPGLTGTHQHSKRILSALGLATVKPKYIETKKHLCSFFVGRECATGAHFTTHGIGGQSEPLSGLVVGPCNVRGGDTAEVVLARSLRGDGSGMRFGYFNACSLAHPLKRKHRGPDKAGCFADEIVGCGACAETICNRWHVTAEQAMKLAESFYRTKPVSVHARAAALLRARSEIILRLPKPKTERLKDMSWLAPVHVWAV